MVSLVCLHGWAMNCQVWQPLCQALATRMNVINIALPGYEAPYCNGFDDRSAWLDTLVTTVTRQQAQFNSTDPMVWIGWSLGGVVALSVAQHYPELVQKLVLLGTNPKFIASDDWPGMIETTCQRLYQTMASQPYKALQRFMALQCKSHVIDKRAYEAILATGVLANMPPVSVLQASLRWLMESDLRATLKALKQPMRWLFATNDSLIPISVAHAIQAQLPHTHIDRITGTHWDLTHPKHIVPLLVSEKVYEA